MNGVNILFYFTDKIFKKANNLTLPKWVQEHYRKIQESSDTVYHFIYRTPEMAKYITGYLKFKTVYIIICLIVITFYRTYLE